MDAILQSGLEMIRAIQQFHGPALDAVFRAITSLGNEKFYLLFLPLVFWCVDYGLGMRLALLLLLSSYINVSLKDLFQLPRPFELDPGVRLATADGYGLPSGHAQSAVVMWGLIAGWARKRWVSGIAVAVMVLIGFSRIYLGVHFPIDVLAGWALGALVLGLYFVAASVLEVKPTAWGLGWQVSIAVVVPLVLLMVHPVRDTTTVTAALAGGGVGLALIYRYIQFDAGGPWLQRAARFLVGSVVLVLLYAGLKVVLPGEGSTFYLPFRFVRYSLIGLWVSVGAPVLFKRMRLLPAA